MKPIILCAMSFVSWWAFADPVVIIEPDVLLETGGHSEVPPLFNANFNGSGAWAVTNLVRGLCLNGSRLFLANDLLRKPEDKEPTPAWCFGGEPCSPTREGSVACQNEWVRRMDFKSRVADYLTPVPGKRRGAQLMQLDYCESEGLLDEVVFLTPGDAWWTRPENEAKMYEFFDAVAKTLRRAYPKFRRIYLQPQNEPNYASWCGEFDSETEAADAWIRAFAKLDSFMRRENPDVKVIGPCPACFSFFSWSGYRIWGQKVLRELPCEMEDYNYHCYGWCTDEYQHLAWLSMLHAEADLCGRRRPRGVVTEANEALWTPGCQGRRADWTIRQLLMGLENPDKLKALSIHLAVFRWVSDLICMDPKTKTWGYTGNAYPFLAMRNLRGKFVRTTALAAGLKAVATKPAPDRLTIALYNEDPERPVSFRPVVAGLARGAPSVMRGVEYVNADSNLLSVVEGPFPESVRLAPRELRVYELSVAAGEPGTCARQVETYAPFSAADVAPGETFRSRIVLKRQPTAEQGVRLRVAFASPNDGGRAEGGELTFNGRKIRLLWNMSKAPRDVWFFEFDVTGETRRENQLEFSGDGLPYVALSASLVVRDEQSAAIAAELHRVRQEEDDERLRLSADPLRILVDGEKRVWRVRVFNHDAVTRKITLSFEFPSVVRPPTDAPPQETVTLAPGETRELERELLAVQDGNPGERFVRVVARSAGRRDRTLTRGVRVYPRHEVERRDRMPTEEEWMGIPAYAGVSSRTNAIRSLTRLAWSPECLFFRIEYRNDVAPFALQPPNGMSTFFTGDCTEFFVDLRNRKNDSYRPGNDVQAFLCPNGGKLATPEGSVLCGYVRRRQEGDVVNVKGYETFPGFEASKVVADGGRLVTISGKMPWAIVDPDFRARSGTSVGINITHEYRGPRPSPGSSIKDSPFKDGCIGLMGLPKNWANPATWGLIMLK